MKAIDIVKEFYNRFGVGDLNGAISLCSNDIVWEFIGPKTIPYFAKYEGHSGLYNFFENLNKYEEIKEFIPTSFIDGGDTVVVIGKESCISKETGRSFSSEWVQVFNCKNDKIISWKEFIDTFALHTAYN